MADCDSNGHIFGPDDKCVFCETPKPFQKHTFAGVAELVIDAIGIPSKVRLNGIEIPCLASARVELEPNQVTRLVLTVYVDEVKTVRPDPGREEKNEH